MLISVNKKTRPVLGRASEIRLWPLGLLVPVVADRLDGTSFQCLHAKVDVFLGLRLIVHVRVRLTIVAGEEIRRCLATEIAIDTLLVYVKLTWRIVCPLLFFVCHSVRINPIGTRPVKRRACGIGQI